MRKNQINEFNRKKQEEENQRKLEEIMRDARKRESMRIVEEWQRSKSLQRKKLGDTPKVTKDKKKEDIGSNSNPNFGIRMLEPLDPKFDYYSKEKLQDVLGIGLNSPVSLFGNTGNVTLYALVLVYNNSLRWLITRK